MDQNDYKNQIKELEIKFKQDKRNLMINFGLSQTIFKIGDIIKNDTYTILIDKITVYINLNGDPEPVYNGFELKKDLQPKKNKDRGSIHGNNKVVLVKAK